MPEQEDLVWLDRKTDGFCIKPDLGVRADDGADHRIYGGCMGGDNGDVTAHYFHAAKLAAERSLLIGDKSLRTDSHRNRLLGDPRCEKNCIFTDVKASATDLSLEYIDGRGTKEFGNKQIYRAVVNVLGLPELLYHTILHDYDHVGNAHGLLLVM